jgi:hypothetical protein
MLIEVAEKFADNLASQKDVEDAKDIAKGASTTPVITGGNIIGSSFIFGPGYVAVSAAMTEEFSPRYTATLAALVAKELCRNIKGYSTERKAQARMLHDIFGNPYRPIDIPSVWLTPIVLSLAEATYEERNLPTGKLDNARLAILADALEDAGCTNAVILNHCRQAGEHYRGCWLVDLLLGKE